MCMHELVHVYAHACVHVCNVGFVCFVSCDCSHCCYSFLLELTQHICSHVIVLFCLSWLNIHVVYIWISAQHVSLCLFTLYKYFIIIIYLFAFDWVWSSRGDPAGLAGHYKLVTKLVIVRWPCWVGRMLRAGDWVGHREVTLLGWQDVTSWRLSWSSWGDPAGLAGCYKPVTQLVIVRWPCWVGRTLQAGDWVGHEVTLLDWQDITSWWLSWSWGDPAGLAGRYNPVTKLVIERWPCWVGRTLQSGY